MCTSYRNMSFKTMNDIQNLITKIKSINIPIYFLNDKITETETSEESTIDFQQTMNQINLKVIDQFLKNSLGGKFIFITEIFIETQKTSKFLTLENVQKSQYKNFYLENFDNDLLKLIPKSNIIFRIYYYIDENTVYFVFFKQFNLILNIEIYKYVPMNRFYLKSCSAFSQTISNIPEFILLDHIIERNLEKGFHTYSFTLFSHLIKYYQRHKLDFPLSFRIYNVNFLNYKINTNILNLNDFDFVQKLIQNEFNTYNLPLHFQLTLDSQRFYFKKMIKSIILLNKSFSDFNLETLSQRFTIECNESNEIKIIEDTESSLKSTCQMISLLYNGNVKDLRLSMEKYEAQLRMTISKILYYNYYLAIFLNPCLISDLPMESYLKDFKILTVN